MKKLLFTLTLVVCCLVPSATSQPAAKAKVKKTPVATGEAVVTVSNSKFEPKTLTVKAGTTVTWQNKEGVHTVIASKSGLFESDTLTAGGTFSYKFTKPGKYPYHCSFHGDKEGNDMAGTIIVVK